MNILIIGLGSISKKHILGIKKFCPSAKIFALRSNHKNKHFDQNKYFEDVVNLYSISEINFEIDFIIISNITSKHEETIIQMSRFKCPMFIEKPVLNRIEGAQNILELLVNNNIRTYIACNLRFNPAIIFLKKYLKNNILTINEVNIYCGSYLPEWRPGYDFRKSYSSNVSDGGGVHLDLIHELDYCTWLFGFPYKYEAIRRNVSSLNIESFDFAHFSLYYPNFLANITLNYFRRDSKREIEIVTSKGTIHVDLINNSVIEKLSGEILFKDQSNILESYLLQMDYFLKTLKSGGKFMNDFKYSIQVLKIALCV